MHRQPPYRPLGPAERAYLLTRARQAIAAHLSGRPLTAPEHEPPLACHQRLACYVSLHGTDAKLRGAMGALERQEPLWRAVPQVAVAAAVRDPRFAALKAAELEQVVLEVVCMSPPQPIDPRKLRPGKDGVWVEDGAHRGVVLPGRAGLRGQKTADATALALAEACRNAGLEAEAWRRPNVTVARFRTEVFSEVERLQ